MLKQPTPSVTRREMFVRAAYLASGGVGGVVYNGVADIYEERKDLSEERKDLSAKMEEIKSRQRTAVAFIGGGGRAKQMLGYASDTNMDPLAVADVNDKQCVDFAARYRKSFQNIFARQRLDLFATNRHYLSILNDENERDVEGVIIATPHHSHEQIAIEAMKREKHVYLEKPMAMTPYGAENIQQVAEETGMKLQIGTQRRNHPRIQQVIVLMQEGAIGKVQKAICTAKSLFDQSTPEYNPASYSVPHTLDWNLYQGSAPRRQYHPTRVAVFRAFPEYANGVGNWGAHLLDIAGWGLGVDRMHPLDAEPLGKTYYPKMGNVQLNPLHFHFELTYPDGKSIEFIVDPEQSTGIKFIGSDGTLNIHDAHGGYSFNQIDLNGKPVHFSGLREEYSDNEVTIAHMQQWLNAIEGNEKDSASLRSGIGAQVCATRAVCIGAVALKLDRRVEWSADQNAFFEDEEANKCLNRSVHEFDTASNV